MVDSGRSFLPELPAYCDALRSAGHEPFVVPALAELAGDRSTDLVVRFGGLLLPARDVRAPEVHEYHSASTKRPARLRNVLKSITDGAPAGRIFLTDSVRRQFHFLHRAPHILRDMGASEQLLSVRERSVDEIDIDVAYIGSFAGRSGLVDAIVKLAGAGLQVAVAGSPSTEEVARLSSTPNVSLYGRIAPSQVTALLRRSRAGLNYVPVRYPFDLQTSTKVIEYLVAGLPVVSNRYTWIDNHSVRNGYHYLDLATVNGQTIAAASKRPFVLAESEVSQFLWQNVLSQSGFVSFLERCAMGTGQSSV